MMMDKLRLLLLTFSVVILISCGKEVFTGVTESQSIESGILYVNSNPGGFRIYVDNKYMGAKTPDTIRWLKSGTQKVTLKHDLYIYDTTFTVSINEKVINQVNINLNNIPKFLGKVYCSSQPSGASVFINDVNTGFNTPRQFSGLTPGKYKFKFTKDLCRADSAELFVKGGQYIELSRILEDTTMAVSYRTTNSKIPTNILKKVAVDKFNNKWVGTLDKGLLKFDGVNFISYDNSGIFGDAHITDLLFDRRDRLWIATTTSLMMLLGNEWTLFGNQIPGGLCNSLLEDNEGNLWIGTYNGLIKYDNSTFQIFNNSNSPLLDNNVQALTLLNDGSLAIGTSRAGIFVKRNNNWTHFNIAEIFNADKIANCVIDLIEYNNVLMAYILGNKFEGTRSSYIRYVNGFWEKFSLPLQFPVEAVEFSIDHANNLWIAGQEGLVKYTSNQSAKIFNTFEYGFTIKQCTSVLVEKNGDVYTTTLGGGLVKIKKGYY
jgi:ligand-binding sensor domain-containing protein